METGNFNKFIKLKNNKIIYSINQALTSDELNKIISTTKIDFFSIDTIMFDNVKIYYEIIENIKTLCFANKKNIGLIVELCGRKIKVENLSSLEYNESFLNLKKGQKVKLVWSGSKIKSDPDFVTISVHLKEINSLLKVDERIIINDDKGSLRVTKIIDKSRSTLLSNEEMNITGQDFSQIPLTQLSFPRKNLMFEIEDEKPNVLLFPKQPTIECKLDLIDYEDKERDEKIKQSHNRFLRKQSIKFNKPIFSDEVKKSLAILRNSSMMSIADKRLRLQAKSNKEKQIFEIICEVEYDCKISKKSYLFIPNADFKSLGVDLLSCREVNEISHLVKLKVDYISISIKDMHDIISIKDILAEDSSLKIIASIPDFYSLQNIDEILENTSGIVLSRTFNSINNQNKKQLIRLTKCLIEKCVSYSKPIFSYLDIDDDFAKKSNKVLIMNEAYYHISDGMDGFFISFEEDIKNVDLNIKNINVVTEIFEKINEGFIINKKKSDSDETWIKIILSYDQHLSNYCIAYHGNELSDIQSISKLKLNSNIFVFSDDTEFCNAAKIYYSVIIGKNTTTTVEEVKIYLKTNFGIERNIIYIKKSKTTKRRSMQLI